MQEEPKVRALVVDGISLTRFALCSLVNLHPRTVVVGEVGNGAEARSVCADIKPDLIVIDIACGDGINLLKELRILHPAQISLVVSGREDMQSIQRAFNAGARAYVSKMDEAGEILFGIESALSGQVYMSARISRHMLDDMTDQGRKRFDQRLSQLSNRELCVFRMFGHKKGVSAIARELGLSRKTIETHQQRIKEKLRFKNAFNLHRAAESWCSRANAGGPG